MLSIHDIEDMLRVVEQNQQIDLSKVFEAIVGCQLFQILLESGLYHRIVNGPIGIHGLEPRHFRWSGVFFAWQPFCTSLFANSV